MNSLFDTHMLIIKSVVKQIFLFDFRTFFDKCTRELIVLPTTTYHLKVENA